MNKNKWILTKIDDYCSFEGLLTTPSVEQSFNKTEPAPKIAAKVVQWSIESVCKNGRRLDFTSIEPNAAFVIKTLSKEIHGSVSSKLNIHPLKWDECEDSELGPFLKTFNNSVKTFREQNPHEVLL
ncbi:unnamed protein product [Caenorhabditis nigoni]